jgi:hypothetical protein
MKIASVKKKIPSMAKAVPKTSPNFPVNSGERHRVLPAQPDVIRDQHQRREGDAEARQDDVEAERESHLAPRGLEIGG